MGGATYVLGTPSWSVNGVCVFIETLCTALQSSGYNAEILVTRAAHRETKPLPRPPHLPFRTANTRPNEPWALTRRRVAKYLRSRAPAVYLPNHDLGCSAVAASLPPSIRTVAIAHSDDEQHYAHVQSLAPVADVIGGVSRHVTDELRRRLPEHHARIHYLPYGVHVPAAPVSRSSHRTGPMRLVYAGRLVEGQKCVSVLPELMQALRARGVAAELTIIGGGRDHFELARRVGELGLDRIVRFTGVQSAKTARALVAGHDVVLLPTTYEGLPLTLLEAMADGVVPIASDVASGVPELVLHESTGLIVKSTDATSFADVIQSLGANPHRLDALARAAATHIREHGYTSSAMVERIVRAVETSPPRERAQASGQEGHRTARGHRISLAAPRQLAATTLRKLFAPSRTSHDQPSERRLRVAAFVPHFPSLSQTFIAAQLESLVAIGHDVTVFPLAAGAQAIATAGDDAGVGTPTPRVHRLPVLHGARPARLRQAAAAGLVTVRRELRSIPAALGTLAHDNGLQAFARAAALRCDTSFDVVHAHFGPVALEVDKLRAHPALRDARFVVSFYGYDVGEYPRSHGEDCYARLFERSDLVVALSRRMRAQLETMGAPRERVAVHHLSVDTRVFSFAARPPPAARETRILSVARLVEKKGIDDALEALARVPGAWCYDVIGDGPLRPAYEARARALGLDGRVTWHGAKGNDVVQDELGRADILLAPSRTSTSGDEEGTPTVILEAMARGALVVSTTHSAIPEQISHGETGLLAAPGDPAALAVELARAVELGERRTALTLRAREVVEREFDGITQARALTRLYAAAGSGGSVSE